MAERYKKDESKKTPMKRIKIKRQLEKDQDLSTIREKVEVQELDRPSSAVQRNILVPLKRKIKENVKRRPINQQKVEYETKAYEYFLDESKGSLRRKHTQHPVKEGLQRIQKGDYKNFYSDYILENDDNNELKAMVADLRRKIINTDVLTAPVNAIEEFPDVIYERERSSAINTIIDEKELNETLEFLKIEYFCSVEENLQNLENKINKRYDEEIKQAYEGGAGELEEMLAFLEAERQAKIEYIEQIKKDVKKMSKSIQTPIQRKKIFNLSPISEENITLVSGDFPSSSEIGLKKPQLRRLKFIEPNIPQGVTVVKDSTSKEATKKDSLKSFNIPKKSVPRTRQPNLKLKDDKLERKKDQSLKRPIYPLLIKEAQLSRIISRDTRLPRSPLSTRAKKTSIPLITNRGTEKSRVKLAIDALRRRFLEEQNLLRLRIDDPDKLQEELDFLNEEYNSKIVILKDIENVKKRIEEEYQQEVKKVQQSMIGTDEAKDLIEFLQNEYKTKLYAIDEDLGLNQIISSEIEPVSKFQPTSKVIKSTSTDVKTGTGTTETSEPSKKVIGTWKMPSKETIKLKKKVEKDLEKMRKEVKTTNEILETVEKTIPPKVKISIKSIKSLTDKLGIKKAEKVEKMLDQARRKTYQIKKKVENLPRTLTRRGIELFEIDPLQKEGADAIMHTMMLEQTGIDMKGNPRDIANLLTPSNIAKVNILGNTIEPMESGVLPKEIPTKELNAINPLASEELSLTLKTYPLRVPAEGIVATDLVNKKLTVPTVTLLKEQTHKMKYLECDVVLNSFNIENLFQARGTLMPKWFPGYFAAFPKERSNLLPYKSPSEILFKAWQKMKPEYLIEY